MPDTTPKITVVTPTYNESANLPDLVTRLLRLPLPGLTLLVVDDNSPDGTGALAERLAQDHPGRIQVLHREGKQGLATAYILGFKHALDGGADIVIQMDADLSHAPEYIPNLVKGLSTADVIIASRYTYGGETDPNWSRARNFLSRNGNLYARTVIGLEQHDALGGYKAYRRSALQAVGLRPLTCRGFAFQAEIAYRCKRAGLRVREHPILFKDRTQGLSKMSRAIIIEALLRLPLLRLTDSSRKD
ncbi:MAG: polyprenol monophosphomannose synthase [Dehalococcoidia bacterium]|nr:polyprenol monophosphomannose synthase [Dehalococcoidia bacterium]